MNEEKFQDLNQSLDESEKQLYDKISQECADNIRFEIEDTIKSVRTKADDLKTDLESAEERIDALLMGLEDKRTMIGSEIESMQECHVRIKSSIDDVKNATSKYVETVREANSLVIDTFDVIKSDFITVYEEQNKVIEEIKEEQSKFKKMFIWGIIPAIIIIVLQIVNIIY